MSLKAAIIGCGRPGRGQARGHLSGYTSAQCQIIGLADIVEDNALALKNEFQLGEAEIFTDYGKMLQSLKPDLVSICLWPHLHEPAVLATAAAGVRAIHCEKPIAPTWGACRRMVSACREAGSQLTFNHQRRFGLVFQKARQLITEGAIGTLEGIQTTTWNLFDWGTHWFDMMSYFNGDEPAQWVLGQMEWRGSSTVFGVPIEPAGLSHVRFASGVHGIMMTGKQEDVWGPRFRITGSHGTIELGVAGEDGSPEATPLRLRNSEAPGWQIIQTGEDLHAFECYPRIIADVIHSLETGRESLVSARRAMIGTELIFATYESSRCRGRVQLPLTSEDSALVSLLRENNALPEKNLVQ